jgi:tetratricopeptide (TPR) repeat protein
MGPDISALWDYAHPAVSEERFRAAIVHSIPDDAFILQTQIARTYGLRNDFGKAREILANLQPKFDAASPEAKVHWLLEYGRTWVSAAHTSEQRTDDAKKRAFEADWRAFEIAQQAKLDDLAIDALHMLAFVDDGTDQGIEWNRKAIQFMESSDQPKARAWAGSLYNNLGFTLRQKGELDEAIREFRKSRAAYEAEGRQEDARIARWMIASTLRAQGKLQDALAMQLELENERDKIGQPRPVVFSELEAIYRAMGLNDLAEHYRAKRRELDKE